MYKLVVVLVTLSLLTGCWDRTEINDVAFVNGTAIDSEDDGKIRESVQISLPGQMGGAGTEGGGGGTSGGKPWYIESEVASSIREATNNMQSRLSRKLNFSHRRVILFGESMGRAGISESIDIFVRIPQNRLTAYVFVTKGPASDVLSTEIPIEQTSSEMIKEIANFRIKDPTTLKDLTNLMLQEGVDATLPVLEVKSLPGKEPQKTIGLNGLAIFNDAGKLVGMLEGKESTFLLMAMNQTVAPIIKVNPPDASGEITIKFPEVEAEIKPHIEGDRLTVRINMQAKGGIQANESEFDTTEQNNLQVLENKTEEHLQNQLEKIVKTLQEEYRADPLGFGNKIYQNYPKYWRDIRDQWYEKYADARVEVKVRVHLGNTGTLTDPFGVKERNQND